MVCRVVCRLLETAHVFSVCAGVVETTAGFNAQGRFPPTRRGVPARSGSASNAQKPRKVSRLHPKAANEPRPHLHERTAEFDHDLAVTQQPADAMGLGSAVVPGVLFFCLYDQRIASHAGGPHR